MLESVSEIIYLGPVHPGQEKMCMYSVHHTKSWFFLDPVYITLITESADLVMTLLSPLLQFVMWMAICVLGRSFGPLPLGPIHTTNCNHVVSKEISSHIEGMFPDSVITIMQLERREQFSWLVETGPNCYSHLCKQAVNI